MSIYLDTTGEPTLGIGVCDRCNRKFPLSRLMPDGNTPGLRVCEEDRDVYDPWRLPARIADRLSLSFVRPDVTLSGDDPLFTLSDVGLRGTQDYSIRITENGDYRILE